MKNGTYYAFHYDDFDYFCNVCNVSVNDGSKHCRNCNKCVFKFDHHCRWLNTCIGNNNYLEFILFIVFSNLTLIVHFYFILPQVESKSDLSKMYQSI